MATFGSRMTASSRTLGTAILVWGIAAAALPLTVAARDLAIEVDGTALVFNQPPIVREGRVFVPLRGLFERLGAKIVFDAGHISVTSGTRAISLQVGDPTAIVDGRSLPLEAPPIVIAGTTLVPLRFVAQSLGANVAYDPSIRVVSIAARAPAGASSSAAAPDSPMPVASPESTTSVAPNSVGTSIPATNDAPLDIRLVRIEPAPGTTLARRRPEISATFAELVDAATVRVAVDGIDLTTESSITSRSFVTDPAAEIAPGGHTVVVTGRTPDKERFEERWTFATSDTPNVNFVSGLEPTNGTVLTRAAFDVSGYTRPKARVRVIATTSATSPSFSDTSDGSTTVDVVANARGYFETPLAVVDHGAGLVDVRVASTAPDGSVAVRTLRLRR